MRAAVSTWWTIVAAAFGSGSSAAVADDDVERWSAGAASAALVVQLDRDARQQQLYVRHGAAAGAADGRVARRGFPAVTHPVLSEKSG